MATISEYLQDNLTSGLETNAELDAGPPCLRVTAIQWDSGFRGTDLRCGDRIVAVNGVRITRPATLEETQKTLPKMIGQYAENQTWAQLGLKDGAAIEVTARRRNYPGSGWKEIPIHGQIKALRTWRDENNQPVYGPGGPICSMQDDFCSSWSSWYDPDMLRLFNTSLTGGLQMRSYVSRFEYKQLFEHKRRVDYLAEHYPGPFASAVKSDFEASLAIAAGEKRNVTNKDLEYRREAGERVQAVSKLAQTAWDTFLQAHAADIIPAFPAVDAVFGDRKSAIGKLTVLPQIGNSNWITQAGRNYFVFGSPENRWYFGDAESPAAFRMLRAVERYRKLVSPALNSKFTIIGRIGEATRLVVVDGRAYFGLDVDVAAAMVDDSMFIDLSTASTDDPPFTGEELFQRPMGALPAPNASPADVVSALIAAIKEGDQALWRELFALWNITYLPDGRPVIHPYQDRREDSIWQDSRRAILGKIYDAQVVWTGDPRVRMTGNEFPGAPFIEEVDVEIEHTGLIDDEYRTFKDVTVNRLWTVQRRDGGPWRINSIQTV